MYGPSLATHAHLLFCEGVFGSVHLVAGVHRLALPQSVRREVALEADALLAGLTVQCCSVVRVLIAHEVLPRYDGVLIDGPLQRHILRQALDALQRKGKP